MPDAPAGDALARAREKAIALIGRWGESHPDRPHWLDVKDALDAYEAVARAEGAAEEKAKNDKQIADEAWGAFQRGDMKLAAALDAMRIKYQAPSSGTDQTKKGDEG